MQDLAREVPVVERLRRVDALVALQPHQRQVEALRDRLGERGLAGAGLTLEQQRPLHPQREERHRRQRVVGEVAGRRRGGRPRRRVTRGPCSKATQRVSTSRPVARSPHSTSSIVVARRGSPAPRRRRRSPRRPPPSGRGRARPGGRAVRRTSPAAACPAPRSAARAAGGRPRRRRPGRSTSVTTAASAVGALGREPARPRSDADMPSAQSAATTAVAPVSVEQRQRLLGARAEHDRHLACSRRRPTRTPRPATDRRRRPHQRLGHPHPGAGAGGEQQPVDVTRGTPRRTTPRARRSTAR